VLHGRSDLDAISLTSPFSSADVGFSTPARLLKSCLYSLNEGFLGFRHESERFINAYTIEMSTEPSDQADGEKSWTQINAEKRRFLPLDQRLSA